MKRLIVLRPEPGASETVERARAEGLDAIARPLFAIEPLAWNPPEAASFDALLLTSANAVRQGGDALGALRGLPAYAVGAATAAAARDAGFGIAGSGDAGVDRLLQSIDADLRLLHLCGEDRRVPKDARQAITAVPVYRAQPLEPPLADLAGSIALIHSPRAGARFVELVKAAQIDRGSLTIAAISDAAAEAAGSGWRAIATAEEPSDRALLALAARLCQKSGGQ